MIEKKKIIKNYMSPMNYMSPSVCVCVYVSERERV